MSNQSFDWSQFEGLSTNEPIQAEQGKFDWNQYESLPDDPQPQDRSFTQKATEVATETGKGLLRTAGRGGAALVSAPSKAIGTLLQILSSAPSKEDQQLPGNQLIKKAGDWFQKIGEEGQQQIKSEIENLLGTSYGSGEEALTGFVERAATLYGSGPFKGLGIPSVLGGAAGQATEELGFGPGVQLAAEIIGSGGKELYKAGKALKPVEKIAEKSRLVLPRIAEKTKEGLKYFKPKVFAGSKEKAYERVSEQAKGLFNEIKLEALPLSKQIEQGIDVEAKLNKSLNKVERVASKLDHKIESNLVSDYLQDVKAKINEVPVPSVEEEGILKLADKFEKQYGKTEGGLRFYSPKEYVGQFRKINKDAKKLYETQLLQGKQKDTIGFYEGLKKEIVKTMEAGTPKPFSDLFKETNSQYSQLAKLNSFETFVEKITKNGVIDPNKLSNTFKSPTQSKALRREVGEEGFEGLRLISKDLSKVKDKLKLIDEFGLSDLIKSGTLSAILNKFGFKLGLAAQGAAKLGQFGYGQFLLNPRGVRDFSNFLKAVQSGSKKSMTTYLKKMDDEALKQESKE